MRESDLYIPVRDWLIAQGYTVHVETFGADVVATRDGKITVVELKLCDTLRLRSQLHDRAGWADYVWGAVGSEPKEPGDYRYHGFGLLQVAGGKVRQRIKAQPQPWAWHRATKYRFRVLAGQRPALPHHLAGLPCSRRMREERAERAAAVSVPEVPF